MSRAYVLKDPEVLASLWKRALSMDLGNTLERIISFFCASSPGVQRRQLGEGESGEGKEGDGAGWAGETQQPKDGGVNARDLDVLG